MPNNKCKKQLFIFYGSLSVLQILENNGIEKKIKMDMTQLEAMDKACGLIKEQFCKEGHEWPYDLDLTVETYEGDDENAILIDIENRLDNFENEHDFEQADFSGNAQGFTAFTLPLPEEDNKTELQKYAEIIKANANYLAEKMSVNERCGEYPRDVITSCTLDNECDGIKLCFDAEFYSDRDGGDDYEPTINEVSVNEIDCSGTEIETLFFEIAENAIYR